MAHRKIYSLVFGCVLAIHCGSVAASETVYHCSFDPGTSPLASVRMVHDGVTGRLTVSKDHVGADASFKEVHHSVQGGTVEISYEVFRRGRIIRQDTFRINTATGDATGAVDLFDDKGEFIRGGPPSVKGHCDIQTAGAKSASPNDTGSCHFDDGPTQFYDAVEYCVSSALSPQGGSDYGPRNLFWGSKDGAWCEGAPGNGAGETVQLIYQPNVSFRSLVVHNGYQKSNATFAGNGRIANVDIRVGDGESYRLTLEDRQGEQRLTLPETVTTNSITLRILSTYPGTRHADTCLASIYPDLEAAALDPDRY